MKQFAAKALMSVGFVWIGAAFLLNCAAACGAPLIEGNSFLTWPATPNDVLRAMLTVVVALPGIGALMLGLWLMDKKG